MAKNILYYGIATIFGEFYIYANEIINETDMYYVCKDDNYKKSNLDIEIDNTDYYNLHGCLAKEFIYYSLSKTKVERFINKKRKYFIKNTEKLLKNLNSNDIKYYDV